VTCAGPRRKPIRCHAQDLIGFRQSVTPLKASRARSDHFPGTLMLAAVASSTMVNRRPPAVTTELMLLSL